MNTVTIKIHFCLEKKTLLFKTFVYNNVYCIETYFCVRKNQKCHCPMTSYIYSPIHGAYFVC